MPFKPKRIFEKMTLDGESVHGQRERIAKEGQRGKDLGQSEF
jgi:hypothetical protein